MCCTSNHTVVVDTNRTREMIHQISVRLLSISIGVLLFSTTLASNATVSSLNDKDFQIQSIVLSNLGPGLGFSYKFTDNFWFNLEAQSLSRDMSENSDDGLTREESGFDSQTTFLNLRYYPAAIDGLFAQIGLVNRNWEAKKEIYSKQNGQRKAVYRVEYPTSGYNLGVGKSWIFSSGLTTSVSFVRLITDEP